MMALALSHRKWLQGLLIGLGGAVLALALWWTGALQTWENATWMMRVHQMARPSPSTTKIKLIMVDQASLDWGKTTNGWPWPWPREVLGAILSFCQRGGAKCAAFDVVYTESSSAVSDDQLFGEAIKAGPPFVGAVFGAQEGGGEFTRWPDPVPRPRIFAKGVEQYPKAVAKSASFPIKDVAMNATLLANVSSRADSDGIYRKSGLFKAFDGQLLPSLGFGAFLAAELHAGKTPALSLDQGRLQVEGRTVPIDEHGEAIVRFLGKSGIHQTFSAEDIIRSELLLREGKTPVIEPARLKDCYVFFGYSAQGLYDLRPTPVDRRYPGVEIHATLLDNLLENAFLRPMPRQAVVLSVVVMSVLAGLAGVMSRKIWHNLAAFLAFLGLPYGLGLLAYAKGLWFPVMACEVGAGLTLVGAVVVNYATEGRQKAFLKNAFRHYLGETVIEQIIADPSRLTLGGEKRELTLFFSDIEKFSSFSERLEPAVLTTLLNDYLSDMSTIIQEEGGYLDKYIGDAIVAFWNAPVDQADHATRACRAAVRCARKLAERRSEFEERTGAIIKARVGLNTGLVTVGNMGSYQRFNYTVLGDAANLASRLEGANKAFGTYAMVSERTWEATERKFAGRELGRLRVVGRKAPVRVFELTGLPGDARPTHFAAFEDALALFYGGRFAQALEAFERIGDDPASRTYAEQCRAFMAHPPIDWEGVLNLTEK